MNVFLFVNKQRLWLAVLVIALLAFGLRLAKLDIAEFKYDEARTMIEARDIAYGRYFPFVGQDASVGIPDGPLVLYLVALPARITSSPVVAVGLLAFLSALAVLATYFFVNEFFGSRAALVASLIFAVNPYAILFGRKVWIENLALLSVVIFYSIYRVIVIRRPWFIVAAFLFWAIQILAKITAVMYFPAVILTLLLFPKRIKRSHLLIGTAVFFSVLFPYLSYLFLHREEILKRALGGALAAKPVVDLLALKYSLWMGSGYNLEAALGPSAPLFFPYAQLLSFSLLSMALFMTLGLLVSVWTCYRRTEGYEKFALLLIWFFAPLLPFTVHTAPIHLGYVLNIYPLQFVLAGVGIATIFTTSSRAPKVLETALLVAVVAIQGLNTWAFYSFADRYGAGGGFGRPLKYWQEVANRTKEYAKKWELGEVTVLAKGSDPRYDGEAAALTYLLQPGLAVRFFPRDTRPHALFSLRHRVLYLENTTDAVLTPILRKWGTETATIPIPSAEPVRVYSVETDSVREMLAMAPNPMDVHFSNGVQLVGYDASKALRAGETMSLLTYWYLAAVKNDQDRWRLYQVFNHFVDGAGKRWGQQDGFGHPSPDWQDGDVVLQWFNIHISKDTPAGEYWILTGFYQLDGGKRAAVLNAAGTVVGDFVRLGPFAIVRP